MRSVTSLLAIVLAASDVPAAPIVGVMTLGVVLAIVGHAAKDNRIVAVGLAVLFIATAMMVLGAFVAYQDDPGDPRPRKSPSSPGF